MSLKRIYCAVLLIGGVFCSANLAAQKVDSTFANINYIRKGNAWSVSNNATGLKYFTLSKISDAQLFLRKGDGDFKNYHQSNNQYSFGLNAESIFRLNSKVVFSGSILYENFEGKNMGGSAFINPYENPFNIVELDNANKGIKKQETYTLEGAVGVQLNSRLGIGGKINYTAANFAKTKDLRHINKLLNLDLSTGLTYKLSENLEIGANYNYLRRIESTYFRSYGNTDRQFISLIDFGSFYGRSELFTDFGYTADDTTQPLTNNTHSGSIQLDVKLGAKAKWFSEFTYGQKTGAFGKEATSLVLFTTHSGTNYQYKTQVSLLGEKLQHFISLNVGYSTLINNENIYRRENTTGGISRIVYYGKSEVLDKQQIDAKLDYTIYAGINNNNPKWTFNFTTDYFRRQQTTTVYPFYRDQTIDSYQAKANVKRNIVRGDQMYSVALGLGYGTGSGTVKQDGLYATPSSSQVAPTGMDLYLYQEFEYFTKPRALANLALQYTKKLKQPVALYAKLDYSYTKAFDTQFLGGSFGMLGASVGCNF